MLSSRRQRFAWAEAALGKRFAFISANTWTALSVPLGLLAAYFLARNEFIAGALAFIIASFFDKLDGAVARFKKTASSHGAYLDTVADRYVEFFIIIGLFLAALPDVWPSAKIWIIIYLFGSLMTTYSKAAAREKNLIKKEMQYGLLERTERLSLLFAGMLLAAINPIYMTYMLVLLAVLANITAMQRIWKALRG